MTIFDKDKHILIHREYHLRTFLHCVIRTSYKIIWNISVAAEKSAARTTIRTSFGTYIIFVWKVKILYSLINNLLSTITPWRFHKAPVFKIPHYLALKCRTGLLAVK